MMHVEIIAFSTTRCSRCTRFLHQPPSLHVDNLASGHHTGLLALSHCCCVAVVSHGACSAKRPTISSSGTVKVRLEMNAA